MTNDWDADDYDDGHGFVHEYGRDVLDVLGPQPDERVLDLGCGTGHLTADIAETGASVVGIDASSEMVEQARRTYPDLTIERADARDYGPDEPFDAVFSNAALHWIPDADQDAVLATVAESLTEGGRFVAELGGRGNVAAISDALGAERRERGYAVPDPWYFPSVGEYASRIEAQGLEVGFARLFDRPTELGDGEAGLRNWVEMFGDAFFADVPPETKAEMLDGVERRVADRLWDGETGTWTVDYRRLRVVAHRR